MNRILKKVLVSSMAGCVFLSVSEAKEIKIPVVVPSGVEYFLTHQPGKHVISVDQVLKKIKAGEKVTLIDVRTPQEYASKHYPGSLNIPYDQLYKHLDDIPKKGLVVLICHSGRRAEGATTVLRILRFDNAYNLSGGINSFHLRDLLKTKKEKSRRAQKKEKTEEEEDFGC